MSAITRASGGDGWSTWTIDRHGDDFHIHVYAKDVQVPADTPAGWGPKPILDETVHDTTGRRALDRAISVSADYSARQAR